MKVQLLIIAITGFLIYNAYHDNKYTKLIKSWKKYYQIVFLAFFGLSLYIFIKKYPNDSRSLFTHANGLIKYMPIDKSSADLLTPLLSMSSQNTGINNSPQFNRMMNSGINKNSYEKATKRCVSETKKKFIAANQNWKCNHCNNQLEAWYEIDHKIRLEHGGSNQVNNLVALCRNCHGKKTAMESM